MTVLSKKFQGTGPIPPKVAAGLKQIPEKPAKVAQTDATAPEQLGQASTQQVTQQPIRQTDAFDGRVDKASQAAQPQQAPGKDDRLHLMAQVSAGGDARAQGGVRGRAVSEDAPLGLDQLALHGAYSHDFVQNHDLSSLGIAGPRGALTFTAADVRPLTEQGGLSILEQNSALWGGRLSSYSSQKREDLPTGVAYLVQF